MRSPSSGSTFWLDESELGGGDAWDQKIRKQIRECDFFMPVVSARTEARHEGYFRREWRLAVERTLDMADDHLFLLPVVIDDTNQAHARVPEKFLAVQWLRLPQGQPTPALDALCRRILSGPPQEPPAENKKAAAPESGGARPRALPPPYPPFPREEPGQRVRFWAHVLGWLGHCAWASLQRFPRWVRILVYLWIASVVLSRGCSMGLPHRSDYSDVDEKKLAAIVQAYRGNTHPGDIAKLGAQIATQFADGDKDLAARDAVFAIPFGAPADDASAAKLADATFAQTFGRLAKAHRGQVGLDKDALSSNDASDALARARANHSTYVVYGAVLPQAPAPVLSVTVAKVKDGSVIWTGSYPVAGANAAKIAEEINSKVPASDDEDE